MVRNRNFWIIEAKAPDQEELPEQAISQAYFYSIHSEVNARYFMVTNGLTTVLYDARTLGDDYEPVLKIRQAALQGSRQTRVHAVLGMNIIELNRSRTRW